MRDCRSLSLGSRLQVGGAPDSPPALKMTSSTQLTSFHGDLDAAQLQEGESISQPAYVKGKVARPMIQRRAGSGVYYRVNILAERDNQIQVYYPPYENDPEFREWVYRTSSRIHRASNGKWSYVGRGGWRYNTKGSKKRSRARGAYLCLYGGCVLEGVLHSACLI